MGMPIEGATRSSSASDGVPVHLPVVMLLVNDHASRHYRHLGCDTNARHNASLEGNGIRKTSPALSPPFVTPPREAASTFFQLVTDRARGGTAAIHFFATAQCGV